MSEHEVLHNASNGVLAVGFDSEGNLITPQFSPRGGEYTIQIDPELIHTKDTYVGEDPDIIDFFNRNPGDLGYGVLYNTQNKWAMLNLARVQNALAAPFEHITETPHQASLQHRLTRALLQSAVGLDNEDFDVVAFSSDITKSFSGLSPDAEVTTSGSVNLTFGTLTTPHSDIRVDTFLWYQLENGEWWYNNITIPEVITASSSCTMAASSIDLKGTMLIKLPPEIEGTYYLVKLLQSRSQNTTTTTITVDKGFVEPSIEEKEDVLPKE